MAEYVMLRSQATDLYDISQVDLKPFLPAFTPDEERIQKDIRRQQSRHGKKLPCETLEAGDLVVLSCQSEVEKFCKKSISIPLGKGLFSRELEEKLVGLTVGRSYDLAVGQIPVTVQLESATRTVLPELTDENVAAWGMEGVDSLAGLRRFCIDRQIDDLILEWEESDMASAALWRAIGQGSTFTLDPQEVALTRREAEEKMLELAAAGTEVDEGFRQMVYDMYLAGLSMAAIGQKQAQDAGMLLTTEEYAQYLQLKRDTHVNLTEEQILAKYTPEEFAKEQYGERVAEQLDQYVAQYFKAALNP